MSYNQYYYYTSSTALKRCRRCRQYIYGYSDDGLCDYCHIVMFDKGLVK